MRYYTKNVYSNFFDIIDY